MGQVALTPVICPLPTAVALLATALFGADRGGVAGALRRALSGHLRSRDIEALLPLRAGLRQDGTGGRPNEIVPVMAGATIDEQLDAVRAVDPNVLVGSIAAATAAGHPTGPWRVTVACHPARWLELYTSAMRRAWNAIAPLWSQGSELLDRDIERISAALARGAGATMLTQVFPSATVVGDDVLLPSHSDNSGRLRVDGTLPLVPLLAPGDCSGWTDDYGDRCLSVRYSVPAAWSSLDVAQPQAGSLVALLGSQRARILRWLDRPTTPGELAGKLHGAPSMVSHHLRALETAGLITRTRDGRHVRVRRTGRGTELLSLYDGG